MNPPSTLDQIQGPPPPQFCPRAPSPSLWEVVTEQKVSAKHSHIPSGFSPLHLQNFHVRKLGAESLRRGHKCLAPTHGPRFTGVRSRAASGGIPGSGRRVFSLAQIFHTSRRAPRAALLCSAHNRPPTALVPGAWMLTSPRRTLLPYQRG